MYTLDLVVFHAWNTNPHLTSFNHEYVRLGMVPPYWSEPDRCMCVNVRSPQVYIASVRVPCAFLTPNPAPMLRYITSDSADSAAFSQIDTQEIPIEFVFLASVITQPDFKFMGWSAGTVRVTIERIESGQGVNPSLTV